ncbi:hypothetical protein HLRTI_002665 [Halorhabdus tiamatea SARL4B]|uniref:HVO-0234-like beta-propeller domain-containing protein n=1 Tax=Halorhabdus tiamatea SARL4B TaxID=1033806 RepID=F7PNX7_9EURY|nr:hypothetical protein [Halorhabdus tiamatea]ERJ05360.1 hypothetical protein HLRTI_002665 [Halorhabdus tiamatea SARL4B]CCQ33630.1 conserved hypothetical protein [Halorhabdus tiamatea SARL4B]
MGEMAEDRIYADRRAKTDVYVGSPLGLTLVAVSDDRVGRFRLLRRGAVRDIATGDGSVLIATDEDVYRSIDGGESFAATDFGPAVAVGSGDGVIAADPDGAVARLDEEAEEWRALGSVADAHAIDGGWLAAGDGVYRVGDDGLEGTGLPTARDVAAGETVLAANADGVYRYVDGEWIQETAGDVQAIATDGERAHAVGAAGLYEYEGGTDDDGVWTRRESPIDERIVDVGYAGGIVAVTGAGTILVDPAAAKDGAEGWRTRSLGLEDVSGLAVAEA